MKYKFNKDYEDDLDSDIVFKKGDIVEVGKIGDSLAVFYQDGSWVFDVYSEPGIEYGELIEELPDLSE